MATVYGNQFTVSCVPLSVGPNTITATATDIAGNTATTSITVNALTTGNYIRITANPESGIAPLETILRIDGSFSMGNSSISVSGPALPVVLSSSVEEYSVRMTVEGIYYFTASVTGPDGLVYTDIVAVTVMNKTELDKLLRAKWNKMKTAILAGNYANALEYYHDAVRQNYSDVFNVLGQQLNAIFSFPEQLTLIEITDDYAKYRYIVTEERGNYSYPLIFLKDDSGIWKILQY